MRSKAEDWITARMVGGELVPFFFELRRQGLEVEVGGRAIGHLAETFLLDRCSFLASALTARLGRDHHVSFLGQDGRLVHAVTAWSPQHDPSRLVGRCVDVVGTMSLGDARAGLETAFGPLAVTVGEPVPDEDFGPDERDVLTRLAMHLPWLRAVARLGRPPTYDLPGVVDDVMTCGKSSVRHAP